MAKTSGVIRCGKRIQEVIGNSPSEKWFCALVDVRRKRLTLRTLFAGIRVKVDDKCQRLRVCELRLKCLLTKADNGRPAKVLGHDDSSGTKLRQENIASCEPT